MNIKTKSTKYIVASLGLLSLAGISFVSNPPASANTSSSANVTFTANIAQIISLYCGTDASTPATPSLTLVNGASTASTTSHTCTGSTNNSNGYNITANTTTTVAGSPADNTSNLRSANGDTISYGTPANGSTITNVSAWNLTVTHDTNDTNNHETVYSPVALNTSPSNAPVVNYDTATSGFSTTINFNASASGSQAAGTYQDVVTYTIAANDPSASGS